MYCMENCKFGDFNHQTPVWRSSPRKAFEYLQIIYIDGNYIYAVVSTGLSSFTFFCGGLRKTYLLANRSHIGRSRSFIIQRINRKRVGDFLLAIIHSNFGPVLYRF